MRGQESLTRDGSFQRDQEQMEHQISKLDLLLEDSVSSSRIQTSSMQQLPTCHHSSCYSLWQLRSKKQWKIKVTDIPAAFLNALVDVTEVIHVKPPKDFYSKSEDQSKVWRLNKDSIRHSMDSRIHRRCGRSI
eukprot:2700800-Amphidinium_carterae.2